MYSFATLQELFTSCDFLWIVGEQLRLVVQSTCRKNVLRTVEFLTRDGAVLASVALQRTLHSDDDYFAYITIPAKPFYIKVTGRDKNGTVVQRMEPIQVTPSQIRLNFDSGDSSALEMALGAQLELSFFLQNQGGEDTFRISATDTLGLVTGFTPLEPFILKNNETIVATIQLMVPLDEAFTGKVSNLVGTVGLTSSTTASANYFRKFISIVSEAPLPDTEPPTCEIVFSNYHTECPMSLANELSPPVSCRNATWHAILLFTDSGSGLHEYYQTHATREDQAAGSFPERNGTVMVDANINKTVIANVSGSCCARVTVFTVVDKANLTGECVFAYPVGSSTTTIQTLCTSTTRPAATSTIAIQGVFIFGLDEKLVGLLAVPAVAFVLGIICITVWRCRRHNKNPTRQKGEASDPHATEVPLLDRSVHSASHRISARESNSEQNTL